jgi:hypothetical protein
MFSQRKDLSEGASFTRIPVSFFPFSDRPTINIEIEGKTFSLLVDLGSARPVDLQTKYVRGIKNKKAIPDAQYISLDGTLKTTPGYKVAVVRLGDHLTLHDAPIFEEGDDFLKNVNHFPSIPIWDRCIDLLHAMVIQGGLGWGLFREADCFFDFPNKVILLAKTKDVLIHEAGCKIDEFIQVPFHLEKYGVILNLLTDQGNKTFLLDTGSTMSVIRNTAIQSNDHSYYVTDQLMSENHDFGSWSFWCFDFSKFIACDGILGVDFFKAHAIYLDFHDHIAYIKP